MELTYLLRSCKLFTDLDTRELAAVQQIAIRKDFAKGDLLFHESDAARGFYIVAAGTVKIFRIAPDGRERVLHVIMAGDSFAEAAMFMDTYPATAEAIAPATVVIVEKNGFKQLLARDPKLSFKIMGALVKWLNLMRNALTDQSLKDVPARFASYVLSLPSQPGQPITINVSKTTIAQTIGTTKETFSRLLAKLAKAKILTFRGRQLRILSHPRLEKIATGKEKL
jgi:CRP/FNR family transcriptional regulator